MSKNTVFCRKCNEKFNSLVDFSSHICPNETTAPKWGTSIGRIGRRSETEAKAHKQFLEDHWLIEAEEQRKKNKTRPVYKKNYRRKQR